VKTDLFFHVTSCRANMLKLTSK